MEENTTIQKINELKNKPPKDVLEFTVKYKNNELFTYKIEMEGFKKEVIEDKNFSLYYFFKDTAVALEEILVKRHRDMMFEQMEKNNKG